MYTLLLYHYNELYVRFNAYSSVRVPLRHANTLTAQLVHPITKTHNDMLLELGDSTNKVHWRGIMATNYFISAFT